MQLAFTTLSPVHIGNGETLAPLEYVVYKDTFYKISQEDFLRFLKTQMPDKQKDFARWVGERFQEMRETRDNWALSDMENAINPFAFCEELGQEAEKIFLNYIRNKQNGIYQIPVVLSTKTRKKIDKTSSKTTPLKQVREMIKNGSGKVYIPGSSIKGAFRTAVFYHYLSSFHSWNTIESILEDQLKDRRNRKERFSQPLMQDVFFCHMQDHRGRIKKDDEKLDLLKVLHISDAQIEQANDQLELAKVNIYLVQRKKEGRSFFLSGQEQDQTSYAETIKAGSIVRCEIRLDMPFLLQLKSWLKQDSDGIAQNGQVQWIGLAKKVERLFGIRLSDLNKDNLAEQEEKAIQYLLKIVQDFSHKQLKSDQAWRDFFEQHDRYGHHRKMGNGYEAVDRHENHTLMHLGYGTGFEGTTALFYFLLDEGEHAAQKRQLLARIMEQFGIGKPPGRQNRGKSPYRVDPERIRFPKSKRMVEQGRDSVAPLGWLRIENGAPPSPAEDSKTEEKEAAIIEPQFYQGKINYKKPPVLDAVVIKSGRPNMVKVYIAPEKIPELPLDRYRNPLDEGTIIEVTTQFNKKGKLLQVSFKSLKN